MAYQRIHQSPSWNPPVQKRSAVPSVAQAQPAVERPSAAEAWMHSLNQASQFGHSLANLDIGTAVQFDAAQPSDGPALQQTDSGAMQRVPAAGSNPTGLPDNVKTGIEFLSGLSLDTVRVRYNSTKPAELQAHAYAQGTEIHVAPGQEQHVPHEAWHLVQQATGRVKPTLQIGDGVAVNDDTSLEAEADTMGAAALHVKEEGPATAQISATAAGGMPARSSSAGNLGTAPVAQLVGFSTLTQYLPGLPETWKEKIDPRRWTINPYWNLFNQEEQTYELAHQPLLPGPGGYHSRERHGAEHTLENIHARTQQAAPLMGPLPFKGPIPALGNLPATGPSAMIHEGHQVRGYVAGGGPLPSGRFATPAWHTYSRNVAIAHATNHLPAGVTWPGGTAPAGIPAGNYHRFTTHYQGSPAGLSVQAAGVHTATAANYVFTAVQYDPGTNRAWIVQHFPQTGAAPAGHLIPNHTVPYDQIPWFSTQA